MPSQTLQDRAFLLHQARCLHSSNILIFRMPGMEEHRKIACGFSQVGSAPYSVWCNIYHSIQDTLLQTLWHYTFNVISLRLSGFPANEVLISWQRGQISGMKDRVRGIANRSLLYPHAKAGELSSTLHPTLQLQPGHISRFLPTLTYTHHSMCMRNPTGTREASQVPYVRCLLRWSFRNWQQEVYQVNQEPEVSESRRILKRICFST